MKIAATILLSLAPLLAMAQEAPSTGSQPVPQWLQRQSSILDSIGREVVSGIPANWSTATLTIQSDGRRIDYSLKNRAGEEGKANISARLAKLCEDLYVNYAQNSDAWSQAVLNYDKTPEGRWKFKADVTYPK